MPKSEQLTDKKFQERIELVFTGGGFLPSNENAQEIADQCGEGEILAFAEIGKRDLKFHRCYFALLNEIYNYLPDNFKNAVAKDKFYIFLKHLAGKYKVLFEFKDGTKLVEYESISFSKKLIRNLRNILKVNCRSFMKM